MPRDKGTSYVADMADFLHIAQSQLGLEDQDEIDAMVEQLGGRL